MKAIISTLFAIMLLAQLSYAQKLSHESRMIKELYERYENIKDAPEIHYRYIELFPTDKRSFIETFNSTEKDELYENNHGYIMAFKHAGISYPDMALYKCLNISRELITWSPGAVADIQKATYDLAFGSIDTFIQTVYLFNKSTWSPMANFLASDKDHRVKPEFQRLIAILEEKGHKKIVKAFKKAL